MYRVKPTSKGPTFHQTFDFHIQIILPGQSGATISVLPPSGNRFFLHLPALAMQNARRGRARA